MVSESTNVFIYFLRTKAEKKKKDYLSGIQMLSRTNDIIYRIKSDMTAHLMHCGNKQPGGVKQLVNAKL